MFKKVGFLAIFLSLFLLPSSLLAMELHNDEIIFLAADQKIDRNYYAVAKNIEIYGEINGDLFLAGNNIIIDSENINGDIFVAGENITIKGKINGSIRGVVAKQANISAQVSANIYLAGQALILSQESIINGNFTFWGQSASLHGNIVGQAEGGMNSLLISGGLEKDLDVYISGNKSEDFQVTEGAVVGGIIKYKAWQEGNISDQAEIGGELIFEKLLRESKPFFAMATLWHLVLKFFGMLVVGMILIYLWPRFFPPLVRKVKKRPIKTLALGLAVLVLTPIICVILMITVIGLPLAIMALSVWIMALYIAKVVSAWLIGYWFKNRFFTKYKWSDVSILAFGIFVYLIIGKLPFVGLLAIVILFLWALGLMANVVHEKV